MSMEKLGRGCEKLLRDKYITRPSVLEAVTWRCFFEITILKKFVKFFRKHLSKNLFLYQSFRPGLTTEHLLATTCIEKISKGENFNLQLVKY